MSSILFACEQKGWRSFLCGLCSSHRLSVTAARRGRFCSSGMDRELLVFPLCVLVLRSGSFWVGCFTSMVEEGGCGVKSTGPTANGLLPRISCSLPMFGVRPLICIGEFGGLKFLGAVRQSWQWLRREDEQ
uniref:Uncharacterized protein n=1 Tax=Setaria viridis TaxID=4556 RepID=A0A4U6WE56_SETVI|nr:hypothetical protein SEVIR_1G285500v2 [Setaria viridis]